LCDFHAIIATIRLSLVESTTYKQISSFEFGFVWVCSSIDHLFSTQIGFVPLNNPLECGSLLPHSKELRSALAGENGRLDECVFQLVVGLSRPLKAHGEKERSAWLPETEQALKNCSL
jgi:hypothetical protein